MKTMKPPLKSTKAHRHARRKYPRKPMIGVVSPGEFTVVTVDPPMKSNERPVLFTPDSSDLVMSNIEPSAVRIENLNNRRIVGFALVIAPGIIANAMALPWGKIVLDLGHALGKDGGVVDQVKRLFGRGSARLQGKK